MKAFAPLSAVLLLGLTRVGWAVPVTVQVLGPDKKPVPGAQIRARFYSLADAGMKAEPLSMVADAKGTATFECPESNLTQGGGNLGFATAWSPALSIGSATLKAGLNSVALAPGGTARGLVVDAKGQPVAGALVQLSGMMSAPSPIVSGLKPDTSLFEARTDASGRWSLALIPIGDLAMVALGDDKFAEVVATSPGVATDAPFSWALLEAAALQVAAPQAGQAPTVTPNTMASRFGLREDGIIVARPAASITGRVVDPQGAPVANISVFANRMVRGALFRQALKSDARGEFIVKRLGAGEYTLIVRAPNASQKVEWVPGEPIVVSVAEGATAQAPELKMIQSATIEVRLLDEATGKGIAGATVLSSSAGPEAGALPGSSAFSAPSDAEGRAMLRVPPGKRHVTMTQPPEGYLALAAASSQEPTIVEVAVGATQSVVWKFKKGLLGAGRVVDEAGRPIPNVEIGFHEPGQVHTFGNHDVTSDAGGRWRKSNFRPGAWKPYISGAEWKLVSPQAITFPLGGVQDIVLARIGKVAIAGKVVDGEGKPLSGVSLKLKVYAVQDNIGTQVERTATTGEDGAWRVEDVPEIAASISIQAARAGYATDRASVATKKETVWAATDAVLTKRDAHMAGLILSVGGQPAAKAQVLVASANVLTSADEAGRWKMSDLPQGETEIVAASGLEAGVVTTNAPNDAVSLKLKVPQVLGERDVDRAQAVLEDAWETSRGSKYSARDTLPAVLAASDPDAALLLASDAGKKPSSASIKQIVQELARVGDATALASWAQAHLDAVEDASDREQVLLAIAESQIGQDDEAAKKWLAQARTGFATVKEDYQRRPLAQGLAVVAGRLKEADADALFEQALTLAKSGGNGPNNFSGLGTTVAPVSEAWTEKVIQAAIADAPQQPEWADGPEFAIDQAILSIARTNLPGARRLLAKYGEVKSKNGNGGGWVTIPARAQVLAQRAKAGEDVDTLLKEVEGSPQSVRTLYSVRAMALIADNGPKARQVELLKRALALAETLNQYNLTDTFQVIRRLLPLDRDAAKAALEKARTVLEAPRDENSSYQRTRDVAIWGWMYRAFDPAASRMAIEREWALGLSQPKSDQDDYNRWPAMIQLVAALMSLDIERAGQLAERLPVSGYNAPAFGAQRAIARWMMASSQERASKPLSFWSSERDADAERYSNEW